jgi:hypothetical protein
MIARPAGPGLERVAVAHLGRVQLRAAHDIEQETILRAEHVVCEVDGVTKGNVNRLFESHHARPPVRAAAGRA